MPPPAVQQAPLITQLLGLALIYTGLALFSMAFIHEHSVVAPLWPAGGLLLGVMLRFPEHWWGILAGCMSGLFIANISVSGNTPEVALALTVANLLSALPAAWLVKRICGLPFLLNSLRSLLWLGLIILLAPLPGSLWGAWMIHLIHGIPYAETLQVWWLSNLVGCVVITPLVLSWQSHYRFRPRCWELSLLLTLVGSITYLTLRLDRFILPHLLMPLLLWAALRFSISGTALAGILIAAISLGFTVRGNTPLSSTGAPLEQRILDLQLYLCALLASALLVAGAFMDRCAALRSSGLNEARFRDFADTAADIFWEVDPQLRFRYISGRFHKVLGMAPQELLGKPLDTLFQHTDSSTTEQDGGSTPLDPDDHQGHRDHQFHFTRPDGLLRILRDSAKPVLNERGEFLGYRGAISDITETYRMHEQIVFQATHDSLTGLPNRTFYRNLLRDSLDRAQHTNMLLAVLFLDLDGFKPVNDSLGHAVGDLLLQTVARRLKNAIRETDTVARLGGDEFVVLVPGLQDTQSATQMAQKLVAVLGEPYRVPTVNHLLHLSASVGISLAPQDGVDVEMLLKNADIAMYQAKVQGRNGYRFFSNEMHTQGLRDLTLSNELRQALPRGEFMLYYQPRVSLDDGQMLGVEALIRWQHPQRGLLAPGDFIPLAELTGIIDPLSHWVVQTACAQGRAWLAEGIPPFQIAVNLSARQFREQNLPALIATARGDSNGPHLALEVELTESMVMSNPAQALEVMRELKQMGIQVAIDDFGTGYSSLAQLRRFPIDCLKIDRSFVERLPGEAEDRAIIQAIVALGQGLHLRLVAEGVETPAQWSYLARMGCHEGQGYLFGRPMSADDLVAWLKHRTTNSPPSR